MLRTVQSLPLCRAFDTGLRPDPFSRPSRQSALGPPGSYPDRTSTGKRRRADDNRSTAYTINLLSAGRSTSCLLGARECLTVNANGPALRGVKDGAVAVKQGSAASGLSWATNASQLSVMSSA